jgi:hypothetical protein
MIARGIRLTPLRRELLAALTPGQGIAADELKRRVGVGRGLLPDAKGWPPFTVSFARALRLLEKHGALEVARQAVFFQKPCASWVRLTTAGERERERVLGRDDHGLGLLARELGPEVLDEWRRTLARAQDPDLERLETLLASERRRRSELSRSEISAAR